jgi:hypothetical protein
MKGVVPSAQSELALTGNAWSNAKGENAKEWIVRPVQKRGRKAEESAH